MTKSFVELIEVATEVHKFLNCTSFDLHHYDSGSYVEFITPKIVDVPGLLNAAKGLDLKLFGHNTAILVRLYERVDEDET